MLDHLWNCNMGQFPTPMMVHTFWFKFWQQGRQLWPYLDCLDQGGVNQSTLPICRSQKLRGNCPYRFGEENKGDKLRTCMQNLWIHPKESSQPERNATSAFEAYRACVEKHRPLALSCLPRFESSCKQQKLRVIKTVRANMEIAKHFLKKYPNFKLVHLVRDPRGVVLSRIDKQWSQGSFDQSENRGNYYSRGAASFCKQAVRDDRLRTRLAQEYPGRVLLLVYDQFVKRPLEFTEKLYAFFGFPKPNLGYLFSKLKIKDLSSDLSNAKTIFSDIAFKWQENLTYHKLKSISDSCKEFFHTMPLDVD